MMDISRHHILQIAVSMPFQFSIHISLRNPKLLMFPQTLYYVKFHYPALHYFQSVCVQPSLFYGLSFIIHATCMKATAAV